MPLFEYRCSACGRLEEVLQKHNEPGPGSCPQCGALNTMGRELSLSAFHLKGGGWYKDLYSSSAPASTAADSGASTSTSTTASAPSSTTTAAPAAAAETKKAEAPAAAPAKPSGTAAA